MGGWVGMYVRFSIVDFFSTFYDFDGFLSCSSGPRHFKYYKLKVTETCQFRLLLGFTEI